MSSAILETTTQRLELASAVREPRMPVQTGTEFERADAHAAERYLVPGILLAGEPGVICGPPHTQKTAIAMDLLISVAAGAMFLNRFGVAEPGPTLLFTGETAPAALRRLYQQIRRARRVEADTFNDFYISTDLPNLDDAGLHRLGDLINQKKLKAVVIDPAQLALGLGPDGRGANAAKVQELLKEIAQLSRFTGCSILFVHHTRRDVAHPEWPGETTEITHGPFAEFAAHWMQISRRERSDLQSGKHPLWLSCGNRARGSGHWSLDVSEGVADGAASGPESGSPVGSEWHVFVSPPNDARLDDYDRHQIELDERRDRKKNALLPRHRQQVIDILKQEQYPFGATATVLRDLLGWSGSRVNRVLISLTETQVVRTNPMRQGRGGAPLWQLTADCGPIRAWPMSSLHLGSTGPHADQSEQHANGPPAPCGGTPTAVRPVTSPVASSPGSQNQEWSGGSWAGPPRPSVFVPPRTSAEGGLDSATADSKQFGLTRPQTDRSGPDRTPAHEADRKRTKKIPGAKARPGPHRRNRGPKSSDKWQSSAQPGVAGELVCRSGSSTEARAGPEAEK